MCLLSSKRSWALSSSQGRARGSRISKYFRDHLLYTCTFCFVGHGDIFTLSHCLLFMSVSSVFTKSHWLHPSLPTSESPQVPRMSYLCSSSSCAGIEPHVQCLPTAIRCTFILINQFPLSAIHSYKTS